MGYWEEGDSLMNALLRDILSLVAVLYTDAVEGLVLEACTAVEIFTADSERIDLLSVKK